VRSGFQWVAAPEHFSERFICFRNASQAVADVKRGRFSVEPIGAQLDELTEADDKVGYLKLIRKLKSFAAAGDDEPPSLLLLPFFIFSFLFFIFYFLFFIFYFLFLFFIFSLALLSSLSSFPILSPP
jgi:hypothetical protein